MSSAFALRACGLGCALWCVLSCGAQPRVGGEGTTPASEPGPTSSLDGGTGGDGGADDATTDDPSAPPPARLTERAAYLVTVVTAAWDASRGTLRRYRRGEGGWVLEGRPVPIILGRSGLGWGRGIHGDAPPAGLDGPVKREGDGRSTAGAFWLEPALGYAPEAPPGTRIPYQAMTPTLQCIEDVTSAHYNRIVDRALVTPDWDSTDRLRRDDGLYELLVFVAQNTEPAPEPGRGSCILFHVWSSPETPTAGCTSMARDALEGMIRGLAPERNLLVQLPEDAYEALAEGWGLPSPE